MANQLNNGSFKSTLVKTENFHPQELADIQCKLDKRLGPEYVSTRPGAGGVQVSYIEGWKALNLANQVFGFNGWFSEVKTISVDYLDERNGRFNVGLSVVVRVTLKDGTFHEDIGYGSLDNARTKAMAFEKAKKEAMTDGLKRALRCFGNAMGNCLYDKEYLNKISGVKCAPPDFDESNLFRFNEALSRPGTIPRSPQKPTPMRHASTDAGFVAPQVHVQRSVNRAAPKPTIPEKRSMSSVEPIRKRQQDNDDMFDDSLTFSDDINLESEDFNEEVNELLDAKLKTPAPPGMADGEKDTHVHTVEESQDNLSTNETPSRPQHKPQPQQIARPVIQSSTAQQEQTSSVVEEPQPVLEPQVMPAQVGFFTARVAEQVQTNQTSLSNQHAFNPQFISPSIRRTVDPTKSTPIKRTDMTATGTAPASTPAQNSAMRYDNPRLIPNRQIGKPRYPPPKKLKDQTNGSSTEKS